MRAVPFSTLVFVFASAGVLSACSRKSHGDEIVVTSATCITCGAPARSGALQSRDMDETSGLAPSSHQDGVFFANNDSGDSARFFAIDRAGKRLATFTYSKDDVVDCEEIARGPCGAQGGASCVFIGDIGDNDSRRDHVTLYRVPEPTVMADATLTAEAFPLTYPDGAHNAEALLVHPRTGAVTIVTKSKNGPSGLYDVPMPLTHPTGGKPAVLVKVGSITAPAGDARFTAAAVHPGGLGIVLRTYSHVFFVPMRPEQTVAQALTAPMCSLPVAKEEQGEAIAWLPGGDGFVTTSEGTGAPIYVSSCEGIAAASASSVTRVPVR
jgi:hypothetical protein